MTVTLLVGTPILNTPKKLLLQRNTRANFAPKSKQVSRLCSRKTEEWILTDHPPRMTTFFLLVASEVSLYFRKLVDA